MACEPCETGRNHPDAPTRQYSTGCVYCGARYLRDGGKHPEDWEKYCGIPMKQLHEAHMQGEFVEPRERKKK